MTSNHRDEITKEAVRSDVDDHPQEYGSVELTHNAWNGTDDSVPSTSEMPNLGAEAEPEGPVRTNFEPYVEIGTISHPSSR